MSLVNTFFLYHLSDRKQKYDILALQKNSVYDFYSEIRFISHPTYYTDILLNYIIMKQVLLNKKCRVDTCIIYHKKKKPDSVQRNMIKFLSM